MTRDAQHAPARPAPTATRTPTRTRTPARRRRLPRGWVPNQHGAWAMVVLPTVVGATLAGPTWRHLLVLAAWLAAYCAYFAATQWLRSGRKPRYRPPLVGHGAVTAVLGGAVLALQPALLRWAPLYAVLLGVSLVCAQRRADRSYTNDLVTITAASVMTVVAAGLGHPTVGPWPPGATDAAAWVATAMLAAYLVGTVPYVKSMIRERHRPATYRLSVGYHAVLLAAAVAGTAAGWVRGGTAVLLVVVTGALLARAALLPRRGRVRPHVIGAGEAVACVAATAAVLLAV